MRLPVAYFAPARIKGHMSHTQQKGGSTPSMACSSAELCLYDVDVASGMRVSATMARHVSSDDPEITTCQ